MQTRIDSARQALNPRNQAKDPLTRLRNRLVNPSQEHRGGPEQVDFLAAVANNTFLDYLGTQSVGQDFAELNIPLLANKLQEGEFVKAPVNTAQRIRATFKDLTQQEASYVSVWNAVTLHNIQENRLEASYLAASSDKESGKARIQKALNHSGNSQKAKKAIDGCVRTVFRTMGGLVRIRGNVSVISDCVFSRHWWLGHVIEQARTELEFDETAAWEALNRHWSSISEWAVRRLTIVAAPTITAGLIATLIECPKTDPRDLMQRIGVKFSDVSPYFWTATEIYDWLVHGDRP